MKNSFFIVLFMALSIAPAIIMSRIPEDDFLKSNSVFDRFQGAIIEAPVPDESEGAEEISNSNDMVESNSRSIREVVQDLFQETFYSLMEALSRALADLSARSRFRRGTNEGTMEDHLEEDTDYIFHSLSVGVGAFMDKQSCRRRLTCQATKVVKRNVPGLEMLVMLVDNVVPESWSEWFSTIKSSAVDRNDRCSLDYDCDILPAD